jgi:hypothetical protein
MGPIEIEAVAPLSRVARFVAYTNFGKTQIEAAVSFRVFYHQPAIHKCNGASEAVEIVFGK